MPSRVHDLNIANKSLLNEVANKQQGLPNKEKIRFASLIRNDRTASNDVGLQELSRRQQEAEALLLRTFGCKDLKVGLDYSNPL